MTRQHGIEANSYKNLILDSGAIFIGFNSFASTGVRFGATRGGAAFKRLPSYKETPYEGIPGQVVGQKHLVMVKATLEVNIISFDVANIKLAIPGSVSSYYDDDHTKITEGEWDAVVEHGLSNIAIVAETTTGNGAVAIVLDNPICEKDFSLNFKDKSEAVSKLVFSAFYKESVGFDSPPWRILWPSGAQ